MSEQQELSFETGEDLKEKVMKKVCGSIPEHYYYSFRAGVLHFSQVAKVPFSSNDIIQFVGFPEGCSKNSIGALMNKFAKEGLIEPYGFTKGTRPTQHGHMIRTWVGKK